MIKFRAWDKKTNSWYDDSNQQLVIESDGEVTNCWNGELMEDYTDRVEIMQYTGLEDKYGVEIYEGDVVRVTDDDGSTDFLDGGVGTVGGLDELFKWYIDEDVQNALYDIEMTAYIEVIGNVYEHPELLKEV